MCELEPLLLAAEASLFLPAHPPPPIGSSTILLLLETFHTNPLEFNNMKGGKYDTNLQKLYAFKKRDVRMLQGKEMRYVSPF